MNQKMAWLDLQKLQLDMDKQKKFLSKYKPEIKPTVLSITPIDKIIGINDDKMSTMSGITRRDIFEYALKNQ